MVFYLKVLYLTTAPQNTECKKTFTMNSNVQSFNANSLKRHNNAVSCSRVISAFGKYICILLCLCSPISFTGGILHTVALASSPSFSNTNCNRQPSSGITRTAAGYSSLSRPNAEALPRCGETSASALFAKVKNEKNEHDHANSKLQKYFNLLPFRSVLKSFSNPLFKSNNSKLERHNNSGLSMQVSSSHQANDQSIIKNDFDVKINADTDDWWKYGEHQSPLLSRLTYHYATPLLQKAQTQRLDLSDAFQLPKSTMMNNAVENLWKIYNEEKRNAESRELITGSTTSHSVILTKVRSFLFDANS